MEINWFKSEIVSLRQKLYSYALKIAGDEEDVEDIAQEMFLKLWNHREKLKTRWKAIWIENLHLLTASD